VGAFFLEDYRNCYPRVYSSGGYDLTRTAGNSLDKSLLFRFGPGGWTIPVVQRTREYDSAVSLTFRGHGFSWETWLIQKHSNNFTKGWWVDAFSGHLTDSFKEERGTLYYLDLASNVAAYRITETVITVKSDAVELPWSAPKGSNIVADAKYWHFLKFPKTTFTKTVTISEYVRHGETLHTVYTGAPVISQWQQNMVLDFSAGYLPDIAHLGAELGDYYQWEPYSLDGVPNETPDGWDFFRPSWLPLDAFDRLTAELFKDFYPDLTDVNRQEEYPHGVSALVATDQFSDSSPRGSWAVDAAGNLFVSQMTAGGKVYNYLTGGDPVTVTQLSGNNPAFFPIAPV
jgi:hypothetical protein